MDWFEDWFGRRPFSRFFREIDRALEEMFREFSAAMPKEFIRERKLPDGSVERTFGPIIYGYSMTVGPDGRPQIRTFGNLKRGLPYPAPSGHREPLVEVIPSKDSIRVAVELPGVKKEDIDLRVSEDRLTVSAERGEVRYFKEVELPGKVDPRSTEASYINGLLDIILKRAEERGPAGERVVIK
ncbi:MAG: archaeal heat shock protein Hsp20 [Candidatus Hadarchaeaceae archaeon]